jgi:hypothetical protein
MDCVAMLFNFVGRYYLVDSGYSQNTRYMSRYPHTNDVLNPQAVFNYYHAQLRGIVERSFGALKSKWQVLEKIPFYTSEDKQSKLIIACFALHNYVAMQTRMMRNSCQPVGWLPYHDNPEIFRDLIKDGLVEAGFRYMCL